MPQYRTVDGDTLDRICWCYYSKTEGIVEQLLEANPGLAELGPILNAGVVIELPEVDVVKETTLLRLWD